MEERIGDSNLSSLMCRACMRHERSVRDSPSPSPSPSSSLQLQSVFGFPMKPPHSKQRIADLLSAMTPKLIKPQPNDGLPEFICINCLSKALDLREFQEMCLNSDRSIRRIIESKKSDDLVEIGHGCRRRCRLVSTEFTNTNTTTNYLNTEDMIEQVVDEGDVNDHDVDIGDVNEDPLLNEHQISVDVKKEVKYENESEIENLDEKIRENSKNTKVDDESEDSFNDNHNDDHNESEMTIALATVEVNIDECEPEENDGDGDGDGDDDDDDDDGDDAAADDSIEDLPADKSRKHKKKRTSNKKSCLICGKHFNGKYHLERHMQVHDKKTRPFGCTQCDYRFIALDKLKAHETKEHNQKSSKSTKTLLPCDKCSLMLANEAALAKHKEFHKSADDNDDNDASDETKKKLLSNPCVLCGECFASPSSLKHHKRIHNQQQQNNATNKDEMKYVCRYCQKSFQQAGTLKEHIRTHTGEEPYLCSECGKAFKSSSNMKQHLLRHTGELRYECPECPKRFPCLSDLCSHKAVHNKEKSQACDLCTATFARPNQLKKHKMYHYNEKPHKCDYCDMRFVVVDHKRRHMRSHTGEKPYKCQFCERAFSQSNDLVKHLRVHLGADVYKCDFCPKGFRLASELRRHTMVHKNEDEETAKRNRAAKVEEQNRLHITFSSSPASITKGNATVPVVAAATSTLQSSENVTNINDKK